MTEDKTAQVTGFLEWIAPAGGVESVAVERGLTEAAPAAPPWATGEEVAHAAEGVARLAAGQPLEPEHAAGIEAIILPQERPVVDVVDGTYAAPGAPFVALGDDPARELIQAAIPSIGRIELPDHPSLPYGGTGFVVGENLLMTNRHVAELFATGLGREELSFRAGQTAAVDFLRERDRPDALQFGIARVVMVHPYWDMALLATDGLDGVAPLRLSVADPGDLRERTVVVVGYPALDPRNNVDLQNRIFGGVFNVKRLQPGLLRERADIDSFGHDVSAVTHDSSTLGGNSGSAVIDVETGTVVALHFAGVYLKANYAVPSVELARDRRVVDAGVEFVGDVAEAGPLPSDRFWRDADPSGRGEAATVAPDQPVAVASAPQALSWSIPLELTVQIRGAAATTGTPDGAGAAPAVVTEALVEPFHDDDFSARRGYDAAFLGVAVPIPKVRDQGVLSRLDDGSPELRYEHFSVLLHRARRLAVLTASNVDAAPARKRPEPGRDYSRKGLTGLRDNDQEKWFTDPRVPAIHQLPDRFFTKDRGSFDKGHIVRREDVAWGRTFDEVRRANGDTFHVTNCSPQIARFNRSNLKGVWGQLENLILTQAKAERYCVFAGPVLRDDDPLFRGVDDDGTIRVAIPRQFWKIVVARGGDELATFAFVLDQDLSHTTLEFAVDELWRTRMISLPELEQLTGLIEFPPQLHASDQIGTPHGEAILGHPAVEAFAG